MKALKKIVSIFLILSLFICGCGKFRNFNLKPDDSVSRAVYDEVGEDLHYHGKKEKDEIAYEYQLRKKDAETISKFVKALNSSPESEEEKRSVYALVEIPGGEEVVFSLSNYSNENLEKVDYDGFYSLRIRSPDITRERLFSEPSAYTCIEGIRQLKIDIEMQQRAEEEEIDWYECWPDLEEVIITDDISHVVYHEVGSDYFYSLGNTFVNPEYRYSYLLGETGAETISKFVKVINSVLEDKQKKVLISVFAGIPDERTDIYPDGRRLEEVFSLRNYSGSGSGENTVYDGLYELFIYDPDTGDEQFFPDPAVYTGIEGIKRLQIGKQMQQRAEEEGIDWYECWPDLEEMTIIGADSEE